MKLLLDTHIFLWSLLETSKLSENIKEALKNQANELWISPISIWEIFILVEKGRVVLKTETGEWVRSVLKTVPLQEAPLTNEVAIRSCSLELPHQDPADRFIAATAQVYDLTLVTVDKRMLVCKDLQLFN
jgi:PIN domain nuclease of toxin-antitoxin system